MTAASPPASPPATPSAGAPVDAGELAKFEAMAGRWWDPEGPMRPLHAMNPCRIGYIAEQIAAEHGRDRRSVRALSGLSVLDIGCGGGIAAEPIARLGAAVTGIDPAEASIAVARAHAEAAGLEIDYRATTAEALAATGARFDAVLALEVVEHLPDVAGFLATARRLMAPGGLLVVTTINRTPAAYALAIVAAERVLGWLPRGTHDWSRFVTPDELAGMAADAGLAEIDRRGMVLEPLSGRWSLSARALSVNYAIVFRGLS